MTHIGSSNSRPDRPEKPFETVTQALHFYETSAPRLADSLRATAAPNTLRRMQADARKAAAHDNYAAAVHKLQAEYLLDDNIYAEAHASQEAARIATARAQWNSSLARLLTSSSQLQTPRTMQQAQAPVVHTVAQTPPLLPCPESIEHSPIIEQPPTPALQRPHQPEYVPGVLTTIRFPVYALSIARLIRPVLKQR